MTSLYASPHFIQKVLGVLHGLVKLVALQCDHLGCRCITLFVLSVVLGVLSKFGPPLVKLLSACTIPYLCVANVTQSLPAACGAGNQPWITRRGKFWLLLSSIEVQPPTQTGNRLPNLVTFSHADATGKPVCEYRTAMELLPAKKLEVNAARGFNLRRSSRVWQVYVSAYKLPPAWNEYMLY